MNIHIQTKLKRFVTLAVAVVLAVGTILSPILPGLSPLSVSAAPAPLVDYIADKFEGVNAGHVFDSVTFERLTRILVSDGKSIVVLGSPTNETSQASLKYINEVAKSYGIQKIYYFDPHLAAGTGVNGVDITLPKTAGTPYADFWSYLKGNTTYNTTSTNIAYGNPLLKGISEEYTSDSTYLLVYDRNAGSNVVSVDGTGTILSQLLIKNKTQVTDNTAAFKTAVEAVFAKVGPKGAPTETRLGQIDYFRTAFSAANPKVDSYKDIVNSSTDSDFRLYEITIPELINVLKTPGTHNILISGSWCPDSRQAIGYISENAVRYNSGPVYVVDFRLDGRLSTGLAFLGGEATTPNGVGYVGQLIDELLGPHNAGHENVKGKYYPDGDITKPLAERSNINFRSPFLVQYKKDSADTSGKVVKNWLHQLADYEKPWHTSDESGVAGDYVDYELGSGYLTNAQKALGRAAIGEFFRGSSAFPYSRSTNVTGSNSSGGDDSGCGDDNDPINNVNGDRLLPNHGTDSYDVKNYDITTEFDPLKINDFDSFTGKTVVTAVAATNLNIIELDFRKLHLSSAPTVKTVTLDENGAVVATGSNISVKKVTQENNDELDKQKLILELDTPLAKNQAFQVTAEYTTGTIEAFLKAGQSPQGFSKSLNGTGAAAIGEPFGATYWFPSNNIPGDGATYKITLISPSVGGYINVSNGKRISNGTAEGKRTTVWQVTQDTAPYQIFASFSNDYTEISQNAATGNATRPFTLLDGTSIEGYIYYSKTAYAANKNSFRDKIDTLYNKLPYYVQELEKIAGKYPGETLGFVLDNLSDGHDASATWGAVETKDRPFFTSASSVTSETTFVHEYAHQWYGDAVRIQKFEDLWLNEGFATYVTDLFYENTQGFDTQLKYRSYYNNTPANYTFWKTAPAKITQETDLFGGAAVAYNRGALALAALRVTIGDDDFFKLLKDWVSKNKGKAVTTSDFIALTKEISDVSDSALDKFFQTWLYTAAKPASFPADYSISLTPSTEYIFPAAAVGYGVPTAYSVKVDNTGVQPTGALNVALSGADSENFTLSTNSIPNIASGGTGSFTVVPKTNLAVGTYTATVTVSGGNSISQSFNVSFTVSNQIPTYGISLTPATIHTFPAATAGYGVQTAYSVKVNNTGNQPTGALNVALSGANSGSFTLSTSSIASIASGGTGSFTVVPKTNLPAGTYKATVTVSGSNNISQNFNVSFTVNAVISAVTVTTTGLASNQKVTDLYIVKGKKVTIAGVASPAAAKQGVIYSSKKSSIASVTQKGVIKGKKVGTTTIYVKSKDGKKTVNVKIHVVKAAKKVTKLTVKKKTLNLKVGKTINLKPLVKVTPKTTTYKVTYKVKNKKYLTVSKDGKISAKNKGTTYITIKSGKKSVTVTVKVK